MVTKVPRDEVSGQIVGVVPFDPAGCPAPSRVPCSLVRNITCLLSAWLRLAFVGVR
jgi:hypothetical protein